MMKYITVLISALFIVTVSRAQTGIGEQVAGKQFVFVAQTALPMRSGSMQLSSYYDLRVAGDSVIVDLPYFGRAFTAPSNLTGGGYRFVSVSNEYLVKTRKKGGWDITIRPNDTREVREMSLTVFSNGSASLRISSNNRDPISFNGTIRQNP